MRIGGALLSQVNVEEASIEAIVTRADGTVENWGRVSYWHKNPLRRWAWAIGRVCFHLKRNLWSWQSKRR